MKIEALSTKTSFFPLIILIQNGSELKKCKAKNILNLFSKAQVLDIDTYMNLPILYVKDGCPWCVEAINFFEEIGLQYEMVDVRKNPERMTELVGCSGQNKTPTLKVRSL